MIKCDFVILVSIILFDSWLLWINRYFISSQIESREINYMQTNFKYMLLKCIKYKQLLSQCNTPAQILVYVHEIYMNSATM